MVIYCTTNIINGKKYIGRDSNNNPEYLGSGSYFKRAVKKYGKENFKKQILQDCVDFEDLNESEKYWIDYFGAVKSDLFYNINEGGEAGYNVNFHPNREEICKRHRETLKHKAENDSEYKRRLIEKLKLTKTPDVLRRRNETHRKTTSTEAHRNKMSIVGREVYKKNPDKNKHLRKIVLCYDLNGSFIKQYESITEVSKTLNINPSSIIACCSGKINTSHGFTFRFQEGNVELEIGPIKLLKKKVYQYTEDGLLIDSYESITEASKKLSTSISTVFSSIKYNKPFKNYILKH